MAMYSGNKRPAEGVESRDRPERKRARPDALHGVLGRIEMVETFNTIEKIVRNVLDSPEGGKFRAFKAAKIRDTERELIREFLLESMWEEHTTEEGECFQLPEYVRPRAEDLMLIKNAKEKLQRKQQTEWFEDRHTRDRKERERRKKREEREEAERQREEAERQRKAWWERVEELVREATMAEDESKSYATKELWRVIDRRVSSRWNYITKSEVVEIARAAFERKTGADNVDLHHDVCTACVRVLQEQ